MKYTGSVPPGRIPSSFGFYAILTEPLRGYDFLTELLVAYRIPFIQLRMKERPRDLVRATAARMRKLTEGTSSRLIVNDAPEIAAEVGADGVHIGQHDMPYGRARQIVGPQAIIGISTHSLRQTRSACALGPDYIGIGPVFPTPTKKIPNRPIGIAGMRRMLAAATVPAVVLGSITTDTLPDILRQGARNFSMVRPLNQAEDPESVLRRVLEIYELSSRA